MITLRVLWMACHDAVCNQLTRVVPAWWLTYHRGIRYRVAEYVWSAAVEFDEARDRGWQRFYRCCVTGEWPMSAEQAS